MTTIDTHATGAAASSGVRLSSVADWLTTTDHKRIGRMFIAVSLAALLGAVVVAALLGIERIDAQAAMLDINTIPQLFAIYRVALTFIVLVPLLLGIAVAVVPLQLGARSLTFPRLAAAGFWTWLVGSALVVYSIAANGGPGGGNSRFVGLFLVGAVVALGLDAPNSISRLADLLDQEGCRALWADLSDGPVPGHEIAFGPRIVRAAEEHLAALGSLLGQIAAQSRMTLPDFPEFIVSNPSR